MLGGEKGISRYNGKTFSGFAIPDGRANNFVNSVLPDKKGRLWVGATAGLFLFDDGRFTAFPNKDGQPFSRVTGLFEDWMGNLWIGRMDGLTIYDGRSFTDRLSNTLTYYIIEDKAGNILLSHSEPNKHYPNLPSQLLYKYDGKTFKKIAIKDQPNDFQLFGKMVDNAGNIWFGTMHGPCRYDGKSFTYFVNKVLQK